MKTITIGKTQYEVYADVEQADEFFLSAFGSNWSDIDEITKSQLLVSSTKNIDRLQYAGNKLDELQKLKFPRCIYGQRTSDEILMEACCEEALSIYNAGSRSGTDTTGLQSVKVGSVTVDMTEDSTTDSDFRSEIARELLKPYFYYGVEIC